MPKRFLPGAGVMVIFAALAMPSVALAQRHIMEPIEIHATTSTQFTFAAEGKLISIVHDWTFDENYSAVLLRGLAREDQLVTRKDFAPLAKEHFDELTKVGYLTAVKINGDAVHFDDVTDYWEEERQDHRVTLHFVLPLKTPTTLGKSLTMIGGGLVGISGIVFDFAPDDKNPIKLISAPKNCSGSIIKPETGTQSETGPDVVALLFPPVKIDVSC